MPQYVCPSCKAKLSLPEAVPAGTPIGCGVCHKEFKAPAPRPAAKPAAEAAPPIALKPEPPPPPPPPPPRDAEDEDNPYGVKKETEEEEKLAEANKPKFGELKDKFVKSARGPAMSLLVMPANLMLAEGALTVFAGLFLNVIGGWPLVFTDSSPSDEELVDALFLIFCGGFAILWGGVICFSVSKMQNLSSYTWAVAGSCIAILPLLAGVAALVTLQDPRVLAGFKEPDTGPVKAEKKDDEDKDEDDDEDEEEEEEEKKPKKKRKK